MVYEATPCFLEFRGEFPDVAAVEATVLGGKKKRTPETVNNVRQDMDDNRQKSLRSLSLQADLSYCYEINPYAAPVRHLWVF